jgi:hypothetical protein
MNSWQSLVVLLFGVISLAAFAAGFYISKYKNNPIGNTFLLYPFGIYVWGDAIVFGVFWFLVSAAILLLNDWILFLLVISVFWFVRSVGETIYFINQQFSDIKRQPKESLPFYNYVKIEDEYTLWFLAQIFSQCITIVSIITSVYLFHLWLK